jgi:hypothetical protein
LEDHRRPYSDEFLFKYSGDHLFYELDLFLDLTALIVKGPVGPSDADAARILNNVVLESAVLHLRNLLEFLYHREKPRSTDVVADDFLAEEWATVRPDLTPALERALERSHKELAHLTSNRIPQGHEGRGWDIPALATDVVAAFRTFAQRASDRRLHPSVAGRLDTWGSAL